MRLMKLKDRSARMGWQNVFCNIETSEHNKFRQAFENPGKTLPCSNQASDD
ncbi:hypothetical protein [Prevotella nigrescens]|uniref:hypothetical protein n=1 Tax=Prevotella nigrescens TaxID=28133 RepID=UPI00242EF5C2|nr:hypothetical protein [Prevotella nigrescens]